jgi:23S rRNA (guanosine2251-2'-O)-methyltransferase
VVVGSEAHGLPAGAEDALDEMVSIPMAGAVESLNVATAGALLCFECARRGWEG